MPDLTDSLISFKLDEPRTAINCYPLDFVERMHGQLNFVLYAAGY